MVNNETITRVELGAQCRVWLGSDDQEFEWPSWSKNGSRELLNEFEFGYDSPSWDNLLDGTFLEDHTW